MTRSFPEEIQTERLRLRCPVIADAELIFQSYAQDPGVCRYMTWQPHESVALTQRYVADCIEAWERGDRFPYVLVLRGSDAPIGMLDARIGSTRVDFGYVLARARWGGSLMPEALRALTAAALAQSGIFRAQATCDVENVASRRTLEKSEYQLEGRLERYTVHPNLSPEPRACFIYARCR